MTKASLKKDKLFYKLFLEGRFEVWDDGKIVSKSTNKRVGRLRDDGYVDICVIHKGKHIFFMAHRLIWIAFNGLIPKGVNPNHKNEVRHDNRLSNLELLTSGDNIGYSFKRSPEKTLKGEAKPNSLFTHKQVRLYRKLYASGKITTKEIAALFNTTRVSAYQMVSRKTYRNVK